MNDLIYKQDILNLLKELAFSQHLEHGCYIGEDTKESVLIMAEPAMAAIEELPAVDAKEHIKGEWIVLNGEVVCSRCFEPNLGTDYCPTCGADMREEGNDRDCPICIHKKKDGCESWECNYERRF